MKTLLSTLLTLAVISTVSGQTKEIVDNNIYKIKSIPYSYSKKIKFGVNRTKGIELVRDSAYLTILKLDTFAIPYLIPYLSDTTQTEITDSCHQAKFQIADIAFLLISDIEFIPYPKVMHLQVCVWDGCGSLSDHYAKYHERHKDNRLSFKKAYELYYNSIARQEIVEWTRRRRDNE